MRLVYLWVGFCQHRSLALKIKVVDIEDNNYKSMVLERLVYLWVGFCQQH